MKHSVVPLVLVVFACAILAFAAGSPGSLAIAATSPAPAALAPWGPPDQVEAQARKEARLVIYFGAGMVTDVARQAMSDRLKEKFGITAEWTTLLGPELVQRVLTEQRTGQYTADVAMYGYTANFTPLQARGYTLPILAPSTLEKGIWRLDPAQHRPQERDWLFINMPYHPGLLINTKLVPTGEEPKTYQDLLDPKWQGKVVMHDPRLPGPTTGWFLVFYRTLGLDYMRALARQAITVRQIYEQPEALARGQYAIAIGATVGRSQQLIEAGAPLKFLRLKEGGYVSQKGTFFFANAPHPNAAKTYLNWLFSREGQATFTTNDDSVSVRKDVPQDHLRSELRYIEGTPYLIGAREDLADERAKEIRDLSIEIFVKGKQ